MNSKMTNEITNAPFRAVHPSEILKDENDKNAHKKYMGRKVHDTIQ